LSILVLSAAVASAQLAVNPSSVNFSNVQVGSGATQPLVLGNSGQSTVTVFQATVAGSGFSLSGPTLPVQLPAGQKAVFSVSFTPTSSGTVSGRLSLMSSTTTIHDRSGKHNSTTGTTTTVSLVGSSAALPTVSPTPGPLVANPGSLIFASVQVGSSQTQYATVTNPGSSSVTIAQAAIAGTGFSFSGVALPLTLAAGQSLTFRVTFTPVSAGSASGNISISSDASIPTLTMSLTGTGAAQGQLAVTPASADFGTVAVGTPQIQRATLTASGSSVTISSASVTSPEFSLGGIALPLTLAPGRSIAFTLTFTPQISGRASATVSFASNAANSVAENLTGTGAVPPQHSVNLSWNVGSGTVAYNVYRGNLSGGPYTKINTVLNATTTYNDGSVLAGQAYYYVTTAVDSSGAQSGYSNEIQAVIPSP
jgi:hypothetical protein